MNTSRQLQLPISPLLSNQSVVVSMATDASSDRNATAAEPVLLPEIGSDGIARESPVIAYTEKVRL